MKLKDVNLKKIEQLLEETDDELYISSITFKNGEPVLNLYKPFDDTRKRKEEYYANLAEIMQWIDELDKRNNFV